MCFALLALATAAPCLGVEGLVVTRHDDRYFGQIDARTSDTHLWLSTATPGTTIRRSIAWEDIVAAELDEVPLAVGDFRLAALAAADQARQAEAGAGPFRRTVEPDGTIRLTLRGAPQRRTFPFDAAALPPRIAALRLDAWLANWDADVEPDGLLARIALVDLNGRPITADATLDIDLWATRQYAFSEKPFSAGQSVEAISRWSKFLRAADFDSSGTAEVRLPFQAVDPEQLPRIGRYGLVHARAAIAGHGVFDASVDGIRLRAFAPTRDQLEHFGRERWLPTEQRGLARP